jgi:hypothetical protein
VALTTKMDRLRAGVDARLAATTAAGHDLPLVRLTAMFELSPVEAQLLLVALATEVDLRYQTLFAYAQNDVTKSRPTVDLALTLVCSEIDERIAAQASLAPDAPLIRWELVKLIDEGQDRDPPFLARSLKAPRRLYRFLLGDQHLDERLAPFTTLTRGVLQDEGCISPALRRRLADAVIGMRGRVFVFSFHGSDHSNQLAAAMAAAQALGAPLLTVDLEEALATSSDQQLPRQALALEAKLQGAALYVSHCEALEAKGLSVRRFVQPLSRSLTDSSLPLMVGSTEPWHGEGLPDNTPVLIFEVPPPSYDARLRAWQSALGQDFDDQGLDLGALAGKFKLTTDQIRASATSAIAASRADASSSGLTTEDLHAAARAHSNQGLRRLAKKVEPAYVWSDLVLPQQTLRQLAAICVSVRYATLVYSEWGFEQKMALGRGVHALFSGPSGTGKTMAAAVVAKELGLDMYSIDLSSVVSKYIGETEKNLNRIFEEAMASNAILFFDEADALFGKRSEVEDAHDRYANIEVAYLLQKMESYEGVVILASNLSDNLDDAFARRLHHAIQFPPPDAFLRERIWRSVFPEGAHLADDVNFAFLANQFDLVGGCIRNVAVAAAFAAADDSGLITMEGLVLSTAREMQKLGKLPSREAFGRYYELVQNQR